VETGKTNPHCLPLVSKNRVMVKLDAGSTLKRLRNRYRLVVMNDDTYEEVVTFKLSRLSVYIMLSTIFVLLVGLTVALIVFTPLKYYIPGANTDFKSAQELRQLKYGVDEIDREMKRSEQYIDGLKKGPLNGINGIVRDTTRIIVPKEEPSDD
jgi:hypothetical protein